MTKKKDPKDYKYGQTCTDHLGNEFNTFKEMSEFHGIPYETFISRRRRGWDVERILTTKPKNYTWKTPNRNMGIPMSKKQRKIYKDYEEEPSSRRILKIKKGQSK